MSPYLTVCKLIFFLDKSAKTKKRDGGTPDKMSSPIGSAVHIPDELCTGPSVGKVISGDDIDSLAINVDELKKVSYMNINRTKLSAIK